MHSSIEVGRALKRILYRLNTASLDITEPKHICSCCKYRMVETHITQDWGQERVWHNWCGLNKEYMETKFSDGNGKHFSEPCEYWESNTK